MYFFKHAFSLSKTCFVARKTSWAWLKKNICALEGVKSITFYTSIRCSNHILNYNNIYLTVRLVVIRCLHLPHERWRTKYDQLMKIPWKDNEKLQIIYMVNENFQIHRIIMAHEFFNPLKIYEIKHHKKPGVEFMVFSTSLKILLKTDILPY